MLVHDGRDTPKGLIPSQRQALAARLVEELTIIIAPGVPGSGQRLFNGVTSSLDLEPIGAPQSARATFIDYRLTDREGTHSMMAAT